MKNTYIGLASASLALLVACSAGQSPASRSPVSNDPVSAGASTSSVRASQEASCTLTQGFWRTHPEAWPADTITIGGVEYTKEEALAILATPPARGDATYILAHQLIAAKLNVLEGADASAVAGTIADADAWLAAHAPGSMPRGADRAAGIALADTLDRYNSGLIGPGHCTETPVPTPTPTPPEE